MWMANVALREANLDDAEKHLFEACKLFDFEADVEIDLKDIPFLDLASVLRIQGRAKEAEQQPGRRLLRLRRPLVDPPYFWARYKVGQFRTFELGAYARLIAVYLHENDVTQSGRPPEACRQLLYGGLLPLADTHNLREMEIAPEVPGSDDIYRRTGTGHSNRRARIRWYLRNFVAAERWLRESMKRSVDYPEAQRWARYELAMVSRTAWQDRRGSRAVRLDSQNGASGYCPPRGECVRQPRGFSRRRHFDWTTRPRWMTSSRCQRKCTSRRTGISVC